MTLASLLLWVYAIAFAGYWCLVASGGLLARRRAVDPPRGAHLPGIVVPAYNERRHLSQISSAVSLARQLNVPIVIVDDGSTDGSSELLDRLCDGAAARVIRPARNRGSAVAMVAWRVLVDGIDRTECASCNNQPPARAFSI
jgi:cellulose synthase/poly-beta-1,6-N-acetylglucosamine synthase-like glycosyltransferase